MIRGELHNIQFFQFYGHFQYNISWLSAMSADAILKMTIKLNELKIVQLGS